MCVAMCFKCRLQHLLHGDFTCVQCALLAILRETASRGLSALADIIVGGVGASAGRGRRNITRRENVDYVSVSQQR